MNIVSPEMVLGKNVVDDHGATLGSVVDVGVHNLSRVKFLVVSREEGLEGFVRVDVEDVHSIDPGAVVLKPH